MRQQSCLRVRRAHVNIYLYNNTYVLKMLSKNFINTGRIIYFFLLFMYNLKSILYCKYGDADAGG